MSAFYSPLDASKDEIRLITLLPKVPGSTVLRCQLQESLAALLPQHEILGSKEENEALSQPRSNRVAPNWSRFTWGDYVALSYV